MTAEELLAQLNDIYTPDTSSLWPLAIGWYIVGVIALSLLALLIYQWLKYKKRRQAILQLKTEALDNLQHIVNSKQNDKQKIADINALIKQLMMHRNNNESIANLHGKSWQTTLEKQKIPTAIATTLSQAHYHAGDLDTPIDSIAKVTQQWIHSFTKTSIHSHQ